MKPQKARGHQPWQSDAIRRNQHGPVHCVLRVFVNLGGPAAIGPVSLCFLSSICVLGRHERRTERACVLCYSCSWQTPDPPRNTASGDQQPIASTVPIQQMYRIHISSPRLASTARPASISISLRVSESLSFPLSSLFLSLFLTKGSLTSWRP